MASKETVEGRELEVSQPDTLKTQVFGLEEQLTE